jgi:hypothetical protein
VIQQYDSLSSDNSHLHTNQSWLSSLSAVADPRIGFVCFLAFFVGKLIVTCSSLSESCSILSLDIGEQKANDRGDEMNGSSSLDSLGGGGPLPPQ